MSGVTGERQNHDNVNGFPDIRNVTGSSPNDGGTIIRTPKCHDCHFCGRRIEGSEPVWRMLSRTGEYRNSYPLSAIVSTCYECAADRHPSGSYFERPFTIKDWIDRRNFGWYADVLTVGEKYSRCAGCGRLLGRTNYWPARSCSADCRRVARNRRRRVERTQRQCVVCGGTFTPPRSDARYCTSACRQRAYRQRRRASAP